MMMKKNVLQETIQSNLDYLIDDLMVDESVVVEPLVVE